MTAEEQKTLTKLAEDLAELRGENREAHKAIHKQLRALPCDAHASDLEELQQHAAVTSALGEARQAQPPRK